MTDDKILIALIKDNLKNINDLMMEADGLLEDILSDLLVVSEGVLNPIFEPFKSKSTNITYEVLRVLSVVEANKLLEPEDIDIEEDHE